MPASVPVPAENFASSLAAGLRELGDGSPGGRDENEGWLFERAVAPSRKRKEFSPFASPLRGFSKRTYGPGGRKEKEIGDVGKLVYGKEEGNEGQLMTPGVSPVKGYDEVGLL